MSYFCHACGVALSLSEHVGRSETCPSCSADLHCCLNCIFYDPKSYNECRESNAERVLEKDRANFCDYFSFAENRRSAKGGGVPDTAKQKLEELFRKK